MTRVLVAAGELLPAEPTHEVAPALALTPVTQHVGGDGERLAAVAARQAAVRPVAEEGVVVRQDVQGQCPGGGTAAAAGRGVTAVQQGGRDGGWHVENGLRLSLQTGFPVWVHCCERETFVTAQPQREGLGWVGFWVEVGVEIMRELNIPHIHHRYARSDKRSSISSEEVGQIEDM